MFPLSPELLSAHQTLLQPVQGGEPHCSPGSTGLDATDPHPPPSASTPVDRGVPGSRLHRGTGSLLLPEQGQANLRLRFICPAVCFRLVSRPSGSDVSQASASLRLDLLQAALSNLGI